MNKKTAFDRDRSQGSINLDDLPLFRDQDPRADEPEGEASPEPQTFPVEQLPAVAPRREPAATVEVDEESAAEESAPAPAPARVARPRRGMQGPRSAPAPGGGLLWWSGLLVCALGCACLVFQQVAPDSNFAIKVAATGIAPMHLVVLGFVAAALGRIARLQHSVPQPAIASETPAQIQQLEESIRYLVDAQEHHLDRPPASGEELDRVLMVLQRQDEKINNLTRAIKMYGKPLIEIASQVSEGNHHMQEVASTIAALKTAPDQSGKRFEELLRAESGRQHESFAALHSQAFAELLEALRTELPETLRTCLLEASPSTDPANLDLEPVRNELESLRTGIDAMRTDIETVHTGIDTVHTEVRSLQSGLRQLDSPQAAIEEAVQSGRHLAASMESGNKELAEALESGNSHLAATMESRHKELAKVLEARHKELAQAVEARHKELAEAVDSGHRDLVEALGKSLSQLEQALEATKDELAQGVEKLLTRSTPASAPNLEPALQQIRSELASLATGMARVQNAVARAAVPASAALPASPASPAASASPASASPASASPASASPASASPAASPITSEPAAATPTAQPTFAGSTTPAIEQPASETPEGPGGLAQSIAGTRKGGKNLLGAIQKLKQMRK